MKRKIAALILILALMLTGCCFAPGNERAAFEEQWMKLPELKMEDYQSMKNQNQQENEDAIAPTDGSTALETPVVNLEDMPDREPGDFVKVKDYIPDIVVELKYSTSQNFTGRVVYDFTEAYLRYSTVLTVKAISNIAPAITK